MDMCSNSHAERTRFVFAVPAIERVETSLAVWLWPGWPVWSELSEHRIARSGGHSARGARSTVNPRFGGGGGWTCERRRRRSLRALRALRTVRAVTAPQQRRTGHRHADRPVHWGAEQCTERIVKRGNGRRTRSRASNVCAVCRLAGQAQLGAVSGTMWSWEGGIGLCVRVLLTHD